MTSSPGWVPRIRSARPGSWSVGRGVQNMDRATHVREFSARVRTWTLTVPHFVKMIDAILFHVATTR